MFKDADKTRVGVKALNIDKNGDVKLVYFHKLMQREGGTRGNH